jgi:4-oxalocrotonate tautomerase
MPFVEVKVFEDELTPEQTKELIQRITDAVATVTSEKLRDVTWVIVNEVKSGNWGVGGNALGLEDVRKIISGSEGSRHVRHRTRAVPR